MKKILTVIFNIVLLLLVVQIVLWSWQQFQAGRPTGAAQEEVRDSDKVCRIINADTGACLCHHRETRERLEVSHSECMERARSGN